MIFLTIVI